MAARMDGNLDHWTLTLDLMIHVGPKEGAKVYCRDDTARAIGDVFGTGEMFVNLARSEREQLGIKAHG